MQELLVWPSWCPFPNGDQGSKGSENISLDCKGLSLVFVVKHYLSFLTSAILNNFTAFCKSVDLNGYYSASHT